MYTVIRILKERKLFQVTYLARISSQDHADVGKLFVGATGTGIAAGAGSSLEDEKVPITWQWSLQYLISGMLVQQALPGKSAMQLQRNTPEYHKDKIADR